jgi:drug/metabolite transporter (DMT)-like permease
VSGTALVVLSGVSGAWINVFTKLAFRAGLNVPTFLALRAALACAAMWCLLFLIQPPVRVSARLFWRLLALGALGYATQSLLYNEAIHRLPAGVAVLGLYTYPAMVVVLSLLMGRERMSWIKLLALSLSLIGVALVLSVPTHGINSAGAILAVSSAGVWAIVLLAAEKPAQLVPPVLYAAAVLTGMAFSFDALGLASGRLDLSVHASAWVWLVLSALALLVGVAATAAAVARIGPVSVAIGNTIEPLATVLLATIILSERLSGLQLLGGGFVLVALGLIHLSSKEKRTRAAAITKEPAGKHRVPPFAPPLAAPIPFLKGPGGDDS